MSIENKLNLENDENLISAESLMELLGKMMMRGYFHPCATKQVRYDNHYEKTHCIEAMTQSMHSSSPRMEGIWMNISRIK
jgi:hypothetical protein